MENAVSVWDFTYHLDEDQDQMTVVDGWIEMLREHSKKWAFQLEKAPTTGKLHLQGRISLKVKERLTGLKKKYPRTTHWSVTSAANRDNQFYVLKEDTRVAGPWTSEEKEVYIPRQVREIERLRPWQQYIYDHYDDWDKRSINVICDTKGNIGKTTLVSYMGAHGLGRKLPFSNDFRDIMRFVMDCPISRLYIFDLPRGLEKDRLNQFWSGIEELKNGYAFDDRYHFRDRWFDCPNVWVFTNIMPDLSRLSMDRWIFWSVNAGDQLVRVNRDGTPLDPEVLGGATL